jgi:hypothetical protein
MAAGERGSRAMATISVINKALNGERHIAPAIESAPAAAPYRTVAPTLPGAVLTRIFTRQVEGRTS